LKTKLNMVFCASLSTTINWLKQISEVTFDFNRVKEICRGVGFSHGMWPWKYLQWKICKLKLKMLTTFHANRPERDNTNVTNHGVFRSVYSAFLRMIFVVCADMTHSLWENPTSITAFITGIWEFKSKSVNK
jgi:hypothetical protein